MDSQALRVIDVARECVGVVWIIVEILGMVEDSRLVWCVGICMEREEGDGHRSAC